MTVYADNKRMPWKLSLPIVGVLLFCIVGVWITHPHIITPNWADFINIILNYLGFKVFATVVFCFTIWSAISWSIWGDKDDASVKRY